MGGLAILGALLLGCGLACRALPGPIARWVLVVPAAALALYGFAVGSLATSFGTAGDGVLIGGLSLIPLIAAVRFAGGNAALWWLDFASVGALLAWLVWDSMSDGGFSPWIVPALFAEATLVGIWRLTVLRRSPTTPTYAETAWREEPRS